MKITKQEIVQCLPAIIFTIIVAAGLIALMMFWAHQNDKRMAQIAKDEAVASFPAQVVKTTNGKRVFIWEKDGKVEGYVIEEMY